MNSGIYCIENIVNNKKYIGQTINFYKRKSDHFSALRNNRHKSIHLQRAFNIYGESSFIFKVLIYCEPKSNTLTLYEQFFVDYYKTNLYNIRKECVDNNLGMVHSDKTKEKISKTKTGIQYSKERKVKKKLETYNTGRFKKGKEHPLYGKKGKDSPFYGKKASLKTRNKMSDAKKGKPGSRLGTHQTEECKNKISEFWRKRREENK